MDSELLKAILTAVGLPTLFGIILGVIYWNKEKIAKPFNNAKTSITDAIERHNDTKTIEYQKDLLDLLKAGYTEEQAKAILKADQKIEQLKRRNNGSR